MSCCTACTCTSSYSVLTSTRVVIFATATLNCHTWGINSSYAVILAYYLRNDVFIGASPLAYAFVGGLSVSMGACIRCCWI